MDYKSIISEVQITNPHQRRISTFVWNSHPPTGGFITICGLNHARFIRMPPVKLAKPGVIQIKLLRGLH